ncbi:MAG: SDR family NAD(P)-dependent oxidoreductase [Rikenellaceae bacterium]|nr:SDR family NAD(P)-dependent oxidoreductase [Rikenellaceae bacterium]
MKVNPPGKRVMIVGATSGIGRELARYYLRQGCIVGITGRREENLAQLQAQFPECCHYRAMDVRQPDCVEIFLQLLARMGGMDLFIYSAGIGTQNPELDLDLELCTVKTNADGYVSLSTQAFNYFKKQRSGHLVVISSLAGLRALRQSPAYSATKRFQIHYTSCLAQKANHERLPILFTTIVPGFIRTEMLKFRYPFTISLEKGSRLIYNKIEKRRRYSTVPGRWRWIEPLWRMIPNMLWEKIW